QHQRDETAWRGIAPVVQVPVVVGLDRRQGYVTVRVVLEVLAGKAGEGGEADRAEDTVGAHVVDACLDVPGATAHVLVAQRLHAVLLLGPAHHRVEAHVAGGLAFEYPDVATAVLLDARL